MIDETAVIAFGIGVSVGSILMTCICKCCL